jgi:hypothetical protein
MSEPQPLSAEDITTLAARGERFVTTTDLGYVVIDSRVIPEQSAQAVINAWRLEEVQRDQHLTLYRAAAPQAP